MKKVGIIGIFIPLLFIISFSILFLVFNPDMFEQVKLIGLASFNLKGGEGQAWAASINYFTVGIFIVIFCLLLLIKANNSATNLLGKLSLLISGLSWMSLGVVELDVEVKESVMWLAIRLIITLGFGAFGFIIMSLSSDFGKIITSKLVRWGILFCGIFIFLEWAAMPALISDYSFLYKLSAWAVYFSAFGIMGIGLITKQEQQEKISPVKK